MIIGKYNKSVILTYAGVVMAAAGIFLALDGLYIRYAVMLLIIAGICDLFDGKIARAVKRTEEEKSFGVQIDSLADMVDFVAFPVILLYCLTGDNKWYHYLIYIVYILGAVIRLGYFNITAEGRQTEAQSPSISLRERRAARADTAFYASGGRYTFRNAQ